MSGLYTPGTWKLLLIFAWFGTAWLVDHFHGDLFWFAAAFILAAAAPLRERKPHG
jgi:hypothetical protein